MKLKKSYVGTQKCMDMDEKPNAKSLSCQKVCFQLYQIHINAHSKTLYILNFNIYAPVVQVDTTTSFKLKLQREEDKQKGCNRLNRAFASSRSTFGID